MATKMVTVDGGETSIDEEALANLRMTARGAVLTTEDPGYGSVRAPFNAMHPGRPGVVVQATGTADVIDTIRFAREQGLLLAVRGGGHSIAGLSSVDGGVLLDLALMNGVDVDLDAKLVRVQGGALWGDVDRETQAFGLVAPGGIVSDTGVAGLTLGGGEGWVRRKYGLSCDNLVSAQVVDAQGQVHTASADTNPDLFWAIRGGGGNFGVVTSFTFKLHEVGPVVAFAAAFHPIAEASQVLRGFREFMADAPDEVTGLCVMTTLPASEHTPPEIHNTPFVVTGGVYTGDIDEGMRVMQPLRELGPHLADISGPLPYSAIQAAFDEFFPRGQLRSYWKSTYLRELTDQAVDLVADAAMERNSTRTLIAVFSWGGAINQVDPEDTANAERTAQWMVSFDGNWEDADDDESVVNWVRERWAAIHKLGTGSTYLNFTGITDESTDVGVDSAFGRNLKRLAEIKKKYDPDNFFRLNNNIKPRIAGRETPPANRPHLPSTYDVDCGRFVDGGDAPVEMPDPAPTFVVDTQQRTRRTAMAKLRVHALTMSVDGFVAGPDQSLEHPLGIGGEELHEWMVTSDVWRQLMANTDPEAITVDSIHDQFVLDGVTGIGAGIMGRNMFGPIRGEWDATEAGRTWRGWWGDNPPYHHPVFVLTHHAHDPLEMDGGTTFHFVTDGIESALAQAQAAAGDLDIRLSGGASTVRQYLEAGLVDEMHLAISPRLLGGGARLFENVPGPESYGFDQVEIVPTEKAAHVRFSHTTR